MTRISGKRVRATYETIIYFLPMRLSLCGRITPAWEDVALEVTVSSVG